MNVGNVPHKNSKLMISIRQSKKSYIVFYEACLQNILNLQLIQTRIKFVKILHRASTETSEMLLTF